MGRVITSSPTSSITRRPGGSNASTEAPSARQEISPRQTGTVGATPTNAAQTSVPPETDAIWTCSPTASCSQSKPSGDSGEPVEPTERIAERSNASRGRRPALRHDCTNDADVPNSVTASSAAIRQSTSRSGWPGLPSKATTVAPTSSPEISRFHIIQPVVVNQKNRSPGPRSCCRASDARCWTTMPPCECTIPFGSPVVPDE